MLVNPIELLALDIDGVITDGKVSVGAHGEETKGIAFRDWTPWPTLVEKASRSRS